MKNKDIHLVFGGKPEIYSEQLKAFDIALRQLGHNPIIVSLEQKYQQGYVPPGNFNIVVDPYCRMSARNGKYNVLFHQENNTRNDFNEWNKVLHLSPLKVCDKCIYFPLGYSTAFDYQHDIGNIKEDIDVSFFGKLTETRKNTIKNINGKYNIVTSSRVWEKQRDEFIARTKINLTLKTDPNCFFGTLRAVLILCRGKLLFSEENYNAGAGYVNDYVIHFNSNNFEKQVDYYMNDKIRNEYNLYVKNELTTNHPFTKYLKEIIL